MFVPRGRHPEAPAATAPGPGQIRLVVRADMTHLAVSGIQLRAMLRSACSLVPSQQLGLYPWVNSLTTQLLSRGCDVNRRNVNTCGC